MSSCDRASRTLSEPDATETAISVWRTVTALTPPAPTATPVPPTLVLEPVWPDELVDSALYIVDSQTGGITLISGRTRLDKWLPDGRMVVTSDTDENPATYLIDPTGDLPPGLLSGTSQVEVSPDGHLAVSWGATIAGVELVLLDRPGSRISLNVPGVVQSAAWSPDGARVIIGTIRGLSTESSIFLVRPGDPNQLRYAGEAAVYAWSPSGNHVALAGRQGINVFDVTSGETRPLSLPPSLSGTLNNLPPSQWFPPPLAWSPDSRFLALSEGETTFVFPLDREAGVQMTGVRFRAWIPGTDDIVLPGPVCVEQERLIVVSAGGQISLTLAGRPVGNALPSPDGDSLAFMTVDPSFQKEQLKVLDLRDGSERLLFTGIGDILQWSADGKSITFAGAAAVGFCPGVGRGEFDIRPLQ